MYGCESLAIKKAEHWRIDTFELWCWRRLLSVPWTERSKPVSCKGNQSWIFIGRTDAEAEAPELWPPNVKNWCIWKDNDAGKDWRQEDKGTTEYEMVGWYHQLNGHEFEPALGDGEGQGSLACCSPWDLKELEVIEWLSNNSNMSNDFIRCTPVCWLPSSGNMAILTPDIFKQKSGAWLNLIPESVSIMGWEYND